MAYNPMRPMFIHAVSLVFLTAVLAGARQPPTLYGHRAYKEAKSADLVSIGPYRDTERVVRIQREAAAAFQRMKTAAAAEGIPLIPISGFRSVEYQKGLFDRASRRYGSPEKAARWVAPPGFSEHHTGWALDVGDGASPQTDVETDFEKTPVFQWLSQNASQHGFSLSFPKDNAQGVNYEPWHWRFHGSQENRLPE